MLTVDYCGLHKVPSNPAPTPLSRRGFVRQCRSASAGPGHWVCGLAENQRFYEDESCQVGEQARRQFLIDSNACLHETCFEFDAPTLETSCCEMGQATASVAGKWKIPRLPCAPSSSVDCQDRRADQQNLPFDSKRHC